MRLGLLHVARNIVGTVSRGDRPKTTLTSQNLGCLVMHGIKTSSQPASRAESCDHLGAPSKLPALDAFLDADPRPLFIISINEIGPAPFELLFCNEAFRREELEKGLSCGTEAATNFLAWSQVVLHWREEYEFLGRRWTAFKIQGHWKCVRVVGESDNVSSIQQNCCPDIPTVTIRALEDVKIAGAKLASLYKMMEMSDVGTFEFNPQGTLLRANESWYRLSLHPAIDEAHTDFSFMNLVYPPDGPLVLSQWNKLLQGYPVTFEMRWKGKDYQNSADGDGVDDPHWVLSACVPIMDEDDNLISIAGNTIDINAQKRIQEEALQRASALERARASEHKFARFALLAPIAIYICDAEGRMTYCNNRFFELTGHPPADDIGSIDWDTVAFPDDQYVVDRQWERLIHDKQRTQAHFRLNQTWAMGDDKLRQVWIESQAFPELDEAGNILSIFGTMTDISRFKWAEEIQKTRMQEAVDAKHKHENFIDMTSHEMRNPLSAVIQCADSTIDSLKLVLTGTSKLAVRDEVTAQIDHELKTSLDSLNTIISCSLHQKRVIDDVLTLSKMDSNLLTIAPVRVEPATVVAEAVHMFELECEKDKISLAFREDPSLRELGAQYVMMDPSRVLQVLINLLTNAIKFTRERPVRCIDVSVGACSSRPSDGFHGIPFAKVTTEANALLDSDGWGNGREVCIWIQCRDTGCGLSVAEQAVLFTRFSQATPRTHIRYGGSGLGLFISKKLTELQGGAIGVRSEPDVGSTFAFFVTGRIASPPTPGFKFDSLRESPLTRSLSKEAKLRKEGNLIQAPKYSVLIVEDNLINVSLQAKWSPADSRTSCRYLTYNSKKCCLNSFER